MSSLLKKAYDPEHFRQQAHKIVDLLADYLGQAQDDDDDTPLFKQFDPDDLYNYWNEQLNKENSQPFPEWTKQIVDDSIHLHDPRYMGHQVSAVLPQAAIADFMGALLNNGVGVYEMGSPAVAMERAVIKRLARQLGFNEVADGILTSGGTLGNLTALLAARQIKAADDTWNKGNGERQLGVMVSEQAHYSISRAVKILGWGERGIVKVPVDDEYKLDTSKLEPVFKRASQEGIQIIGVVGSACSTATGSFDPLTEIAQFCQKRDLWFHADAAHGGAAAFSEKHRHLLNGIHRADSVIVDFHKMLMCPALVTGLIFKDGSHSYQTFAQNADYLWSKKGREWFNLGKRTFECTKDMMALKAFSIFQQYGTELFKENVVRLFSLGQLFSEEISARPSFELLTPPQCNIVCFRHLPNRISDVNTHNANLRENLIKEGKYFVVQTTINGNVYLRTSLMNPFTDKTHLIGLLDKIEVLAEA